uniref:protein LONGIFOLIA 1 isoform X2 n=1 Tax=Erigeron canadensis TaxID=72917 RepID=UPI001CB99B93|nr:protein LONGIFOLIA 1 isoform X2 [Erigeron canadensis]
MAAKLLHSLADDNPDLQKQIGCMTGVFQLFDRHQVVAGRRFPGHSPKRLSLPPGSPQFDYGAPESESSTSYQRPYVVEKHSNKVIQDKNRASTESSRDSFSSMSRSSSFSSVDYNLNRTAHPESDHTVFPETPSRDSVTRQSCGTQQMNRQSVDLRDVVKDSMYRNKPLAKDEAPEHVMNYRESLDALAKFQEASWYYNEPRELSRSKSYQVRDGSSFSIPNDCPRFSYDGRETNRLSYQSRDNAKKITSKQLEEVPRFSLDSRESSARSLNSVSKADSLSRNPKTDGPTQSRPPSVVAKLMGLETLPDSDSANKKELGISPIRTSRVEDVNLLSKALKATDHFGPIKMHNSSKSSMREPTSPLWRNSEMKPIPKFPIEPAPWKQRDGARSPKRPVSRVMKSPTRIHSPYSSVYSEVDKRLKHLEFTQSGKDLRALKQILEAMQSMESRKEETESMVRRQPIPTQNEKFSDRQNSRGSNHLRAYESPIVIMKPAKLVERSGMHVEDFANDNTKYFTNNIPKSTRRENAVNTTEVKAGGRHTRNASSLPKQQQLPKENATTSGKSTGSISPRLQQKRPELDRRSRPPTPPVDSNKARKPLTKQVPESTSPGGRRRSKYSNVQQSDDRDREVGGRSKKFTTPNCSEDIDYRQSPSSMQEKSTLILREDESLDPEYPSPISVLDDAVYMDDSPSPVKHMPKTLKDEATQEVKDQWATPDDVISDTLSTGVTSEINRIKLQNIEHLVQKLTRLNSSHNEAQTDYIASLCENAKPDDRYISEILLASGLLLRDLGSSLTTFQFHSSGYPINPELFLVLEQTKFSNVPKHDPATPEKIIRKEKFNRKLIFDTVNEILTGKLALVMPSLEAYSRKRLAKKTLNAQKLLQDLCVEIEQLQVKSKSHEIILEEEDDELKTVLWEEVLNRAESWTDYDGEVPVIALEVERLIFKDLVNEVVLSEAADGKRAKPGRRRRQLFSK